ncbi:MAG TPA: dihydrofolate reductase, partial [Puia sp.]
NFVITRQKDWNPRNEKVTVTANLQEALEAAKATDCKEAFVIGGGEIYKESMPIADRIYITRVHTQLEGDTYFPDIDEKQWQLTDHRDFPADEKHAYAYSFQVWERKK